MRIISIQIYKCYGDEPVCLGSTYELGFVGYFQRGTLKEFINFNSRTVIGRTAKEERLEITLEKGVCYSYVSSELTGVTIITDEEYPRRVATDLMIKIIEDLTAFIYQNKINLQAITKDTDIKFSLIEEIIKTWQNPSEKDNLLKLQSELNEVTGIMKKNMQELMKRNENLDSLMAKSKDLSSVSLEFYKKAKSGNKCCNIG